jgi:hypothetical protein
MNIEEIIKELDKLKKQSNEYSNYALMNEGYRVAIMDALDIVKKLTIPFVVVPKGTLCETCNKLDEITITLCKECYLESWD